MIIYDSKNKVLFRVEEVVREKSSLVAYSKNKKYSCKLMRFSDSFQAAKELPGFHPSLSCNTYLFLKGDCCTSYGSKTEFFKDVQKNLLRVHNDDEPDYEDDN